MSQRKPTTRGFTLVELLVVIGIIALLVSILLPVLGKVRESANSVKCLSNLRQIAYAVIMYDQSQRTLPGPALRAILDPEVYRPAFNSPQYADLKNVQWPENLVMSRLLNGNTKLFHCPSNVELRDAAIGNNPGASLIPKRTVLGYSYFINNTPTSLPDHFFGYWYADDDAAPGTILTPANRPKKIAEVRTAGKTNATYEYQRNGANCRGAAAIWMITDVDGRNFSWSQSRNFGIADSGKALSDRQWQPPHRKNKKYARNYVFFDGHGETRSIDETPGGLPGRNILPNGFDDPNDTGRVK